MSSALIEGKTVAHIRQQLRLLVDKKDALDTDLQTEISAHYTEVVQFVQFVGLCMADLQQIAHTLEAAV